MAGEGHMYAFTICVTSLVTTSMHYCETERTFHPVFNVVTRRSESVSLRRMGNRGGLSLTVRYLWHSFVGKESNNVSSIIIDLKNM